MVDTIKETVKDALKDLYEELEKSNKELELSHMKKITTIANDVASLGARMNIRDFVYLQDILITSLNINLNMIKKYHLKKDENKAIKTFLTIGLKKVVEALEKEEMYEDHTTNIINDRLFMEAYKNLVVEPWIFHKNLIIEGRITREELKKESIEENNT